MISRRTSPNFQSNNIAFNAGLISYNPNPQITYYEQEQADELRIKAWESVKSGALFKAERIYQDSLSIDANNSNTWHGYGDVLSKLSKFNESNNAFETAIYLNNYHNNTKNESATWAFLGWNNQKQGYLKIAEKYYVESLAINPNNEMSKHALKTVRSFKIPNTLGSKVYIVTAESGLRLRAQPSTRSRVVENLPYEGDVNLLKYVGKEIQISGKKSRWAQVDYQGKIGYLFGAYISRAKDYNNRTNPIPSQHTINTYKSENKQSHPESNHYHGQRNHAHPLPHSSSVHQHNNGPYSTVGINSGHQQSEVESSRKKHIFVIQAGVFSTTIGADKHQSSLATTTLKPIVTRRIKSGKPMYYVEFSGFNSMQAAQLEKTKIAKMNPTENFFVKKY